MRSQPRQPFLRRAAVPGILLSLLLLTSLHVGITGEAPAAPAEAPVMTKTVKMDAENWRWIPDEIRVLKGTKVTIKIRNFDATHRFDLKEYGLKVALPQDKTTVIEFVADKVGTFKWKCGRPCGNSCPKMRGKLIVVESEI